MYRSIKYALTYDRVVICVTGLCILSLYIFVLSNRQVAAYPLVPPIKIEQKFTGAKPQPLVKPVPVMMVGSAEKLSDVFRRIGYQLDGVKRHGRVPRLFLASLPRDLSAVRVPAARKMLFIQSALPLILHVNELILAERKQVLGLKAQLDLGVELGSEDVASLDRIRERYDLDRLDFVELLRRIDVVPPSLALAQGAEESGWGTSRFAREGNALFGQRVFKGTNGIVPQKREEGQRHRVRAFNHLIDGIKAYLDNLNIHPAYGELRAAREKMRGDGQTIDGDVLAQTLVKYSERREDYVASIRTIIRYNGLRQFDKARLGDRLTIIASGPDA